MHAYKNDTHVYYWYGPALIFSQPEQQTLTRLGRVRLTLDWDQKSFSTVFKLLNIAQVSSMNLLIFIAPPRELFHFVRINYLSLPGFELRSLDLPDKILPLELPLLSFVSFYIFSWHIITKSSSKGSKTVRRVKTSKEFIIIFWV